MSTPVGFVAADWPAPPGVVAGCTMRSGGVSEAGFASLNLGAHVGDDGGAVRENRQRFVSDCGLPAEPSWLAQVHGTKVVVDPPPDSLPEADAILARQPDAVCAVMTADCLPVIFASADGEELAAAHAGWRGLCGGVLEATVQAFGVSPDRILAWLGPAVSQENYETGDDVRQAFIGRDRAAAQCFIRNERGRWQADLYRLARQRLNAAGVQQIFGGGLCTHDDSGRFFSYRRDGQCGRMASFVFRYNEIA